jgi:phosphotransferase system, enzyme I, PtsP
MPLTAAASAREILTGLHEVMAKRGSVQAKLDRVVDLIAEAMSSDVCSIYLLRDNVLELFATHGLRKEAVHVTRLRMGEGLVGTIAGEGRILNLAKRPSIRPSPIVPRRARNASTASPVFRSSGLKVRSGC